MIVLSRNRTYTPTPQGFKMMRTKYGDRFSCRSHKNLFGEEHAFKEGETVVAKYNGSTRWYCMECARRLNLD